MLKQPVVKFGASSERGRIRAENVLGSVDSTVRICRIPRRNNLHEIYQRSDPYLGDLRASSLCSSLQHPQLHPSLFARPDQGA